MSEKNTLQMPVEVIPLWLEGAPGTENWDYPEEEALLPPKTKVVRNVTQPTLSAYIAESTQATGDAVIVCPGGAFHFLSYEHEGTAVAQWLNQHGITAFVLKYRVIQTGDDFPEVVWNTMQDSNRMGQVVETISPLSLADGQQAVRLVRQRAAEWGIKANRIGMLGFSAGGNVTANAALQYDRDSKPDFAAVIYGGSNQKMDVPTDAPPLFLLCAGDDAMASASSLERYAAWKAAGRPAELHIFAAGGHGFGMFKQNLPCDTWIERFADWLRGLD